MSALCALRPGRQWQVRLSAFDDDARLYIGCVCIMCLWVCVGRRHRLWSRYQRRKTVRPCHTIYCWCFERFTKGDNMSYIGKTIKTMQKILRHRHRHSVSANHRPHWCLIKVYLSATSGVSHASQFISIAIAIPLYMLYIYIFYIIIIVKCWLGTAVFAPNGHHTIHIVSFLTLFSATCTVAEAHTFE